MPPPQCVGLSEKLSIR